MTGVPTAGAMETEAGVARSAGRRLVVAIQAGARAMKMYPPEHQSVQRALEDLASLARELQRETGELEIRAEGEFIFVNGTRLRLDLTNYASFGRVLDLFRAAGVGMVRVTRDASAREWFALISLLGTIAGDTVGGAAEIATRLAAAGIDAFEVAAPSEADDQQPDREAALAAAKRTYAQSVALTREVINSSRMGRAPTLRKVKRAVQLIVDEVLNEEASLIGLTALRDYDEYTYTHSVNVCIFAVALGKRLGMSKLELYELGVAALMHDIGKSRVPTELLQKSTPLETEEWQRIASHPWLGLLALHQMKGMQDVPYRAMIVAHEHHMKCDLSGYPRTIRPRAMSMLSRIVAVADGYDAATTRRSYQTQPWTPSDVLKEMRDNPGRGLDPVVVKAFMNLLGIYPPGTLVVLDTFELAVVTAANPSPELASRPVVAVASDANGNLLSPPLKVDLATRNDAGQFARTIIKTADPGRYGIRVSDYIV